MVSINQLYKMSQTPTRTTWIFTSLLSIIALFGIVFAQLNQEIIFPTINTTISMDNAEAVAKATVLDKKSPLGLGPKSQMVSAYLTNSDVNNYLSLQDPSNKLLKEALASRTIQTSFWSVRTFIPQTIQENFYYFAPDGSPFGFKLKLPESKSLPNIDKQAATDLATKTLQNYKIKGIQISDYQLRDYTQERIKDRIDHHFIYENTQRKIAEADLEMHLTISGNQVSNLRPNVKLPENFYRDFDNMRSFNGSFGAIGGAILIIGYGSIILASILFGWRKKSLNWRETTAISVIIAIFLGLNGINVMPLIWFSGYNTAQTSTGFITQTVLSQISFVLSQFVQIFITLLAGEYLTRKTRPHLPQLWNWWHVESASSQNTSYLIFLGYVIFGLTTGYQAIFYLVAQQIPGVWIPTGQLVDPNFISTYIPALTPFSMSLNAGVWEELLFRAVPIGAALIIGKRYNCLTLVTALIIPIQAIIFGMAHASYPQQPFFIRTIELGIPFAVFGIIYLVYGLLPIITAHFLFDVYAFSTVLFNMNTPNIWIQQTLVFLTLAIPAIIVLYAKIVTGNWVGSKIPQKYLNRNWKTPEKVGPEDETEIIISPPSSPIRLSVYIVVSLVTVIGLSQLWYSIPQTIQPLSSPRSSAITTADQLAKKQQLDLTQSWIVSTIVTLSGSDTAIAYLIDTFGKDTATSLLQKPIVQSNGEPLNISAHMPNYAWHTRFATFAGTQDERAQELMIDNTNNSVDFQHQISENTLRPSLSESEAIILANSQVGKITPQVKSFRIIKKQPTTMPNNRIDWKITYEAIIDDQFSALKPRIDISITGNQVSGQGQYLHLPEKWIQARRINEQNNNLVLILESILWTLITLSILSISLNRFVNSTVNYTVLRNVGLLMLALYGISYLNTINYLLMQLSTSMDFTNQIVSHASSWGIMNFLRIFMICVTLHYVVNSQSQFKTTTLTPSLLSGVFFGLILIAVRYIVTQTTMPTVDWTLGKTTIVSGQIPWVSAIDVGLQYFFVTLFALTASLHTMTKKRSILLFLFAALTLTLIAKSLSFEHRVFITPVKLHLLIYASLFLITCIGWHSIIRKNPLVIPVTTATIIITNLLMLTRATVAPGYTIVIAVYIAMVMLWTYGLMTLLQRHQHHGQVKNQ